MSLKKIILIMVIFILMFLCISCVPETDSSQDNQSRYKEKDHFAEIKVLDNSKVVFDAHKIFEEEEDFSVMTEIYMDSSYNGKNENGSFSSPFKSFSKTLNAVSKKISEGMSGDIIVYLREGTYYLESTVYFDRSVSGQKEHSVIIKNYPDEKVVIAGGKPLSDWERVENKLYYKALVDADYPVYVMYENGKSSFPARHPDIRDGEIVYNRVFKTDINDKLSNFIFSASDFPTITDSEKVQLNVWPGGLTGEISWYEDLIDVKNIDFDKEIVTLSKPARYILGKGTRYFLQNAIEFLDSPGEFYHDSDSKIIYYFPISGNPNDSTVLIPNDGHIFYFLQSGGDYASNIIIEGLEFTSSNREMDAFRISGSENITIRNCIFDGIGGNGIYIEDFAQNIKIYNNKINNTGASGVYIHGSENVEILNNHISNAGTIIGHVAAVSINMGRNTVVSHNLIHDVRRSGIDLRGNGNDDTVISFNDLHTCTTDSQDIAPIYAYDTGENITIKNNRIHNSTIPFSFGAGLYLDDKSRGFIVKNNLLYDLQLEETDGNLNTLIVSKGWNNKIYNNILVDNNLKRGGEAFSTWPMDNFKNSEISIYQNIFHHNKPEISFIFNSMGEWNGDRYSYIDRNVYFTKSEDYLFKFDNGNLDFDAWNTFNKGEFDKNTLLTDPLFIDREDGDYRLAFNSPAYKCGFEDINLQDIGLTGNFPIESTEEEIERVFVRERGKEVNSGTIYLSPEEVISIEIMARTKSGYVANLIDAQITGVVSDKSIILINIDGGIKGISTGISEVSFSINHNGVEKKTKLFVIVEE